MRLIIALLSFLAGLSAFAESNVVPTLTPEQFDRLRVEDLRIGTIYPTAEFLPFLQWKQTRPVEFAFLTPTENYLEPTIIETGEDGKSVDQGKMHMFIMRLHLILNKEVSQINLNKFLDVSTLNKLDLETENRLIAREDLITKTAGHGRVPNFKWCTKPETTADGNRPFLDEHKNPVQIPPPERPNLEKNLSYLDPDDLLCRPSHNSICFESCTYLPPGIRHVVRIQGSYSNPEKKSKARVQDLQLVSQSEIKVNSDSARFYEYEPKPQLLTGFRQRDLGGIQLTSFYFNQVFRYAKIYVVLQAHPKAPKLTVLSAYFAIAIKKSTWDKPMRQSVLKRGNEIPAAPSLPEQAFDKLHAIIDNVLQDNP